MPKKIDLLVGYIAARFIKTQKELSYRLYVTNALQMIAKGDEYPISTWYEIVEPPPEIDPVQVIDETIAKAGLVVV